ncbi:MAG TPA: LysE family transporter [Methanotrichaceae archaeon]|nr:LysE family transporter [Methanotrichaceae archaeon]
MYGVLEVLAMGFTIGLTGALAPGPTLVATVNSSLKFGWTTGPKVAVGHALVELVIFILIVQGIALAPQRYSSYIAVVGGIALIFFGALTLKESRNASMISPDGGRAENPYLAGVLTSAANPYFWIWWLSIGSAMVLDGLRTSLLLAGLFMIGHWGADFGWYALVSASLDRGRTVLSERNYRRVMAFCGMLLMVFGMYYLTRA